jgi:hypothetical protein
MRTTFVRSVMRTIFVRTKGIVAKLQLHNHALVKDHLPFRPPASYGAPNFTKWHPSATQSVPKRCEKGAERLKSATKRLLFPHLIFLTSDVRRSLVPDSRCQDLSLPKRLQKGAYWECLAAQLAPVVSKMGPDGHQK